MNSSSMEDNALTALCWNSECSSLLAMQLVPALFDTINYQRICSKALDFIARYGVPPRSHIRDLMEAELRRTDDNAILLRKTMDDMETLSHDLNPQYVVDSLERFISIQQRKTAAMKALDALHRGELEEADDFLHDLPTAPSFNIGTWLHDADRVLRGLTREETDFFSIGIKVLDDRGATPARKTLTVLIGPAKRGKCVAGDELILLADGRHKSIADVVQDRDRHVMTLDEATGLIVPGEVTGHWARGLQQCYKVTTSTGRCVKLTAQHLLRTEHGWLPLHDIIAGQHRIAIPISVSNLGRVQMKSWQPRLLGMVIADCSLTHHSERDIVFTKADIDVIQQMPYERVPRFAYNCTTWSDNVMFDRVESIKDAGLIQTYDLTVAEHQNFIASDVVVHNSWFLHGIGKAGLMHHHPTLHITLENSEELALQRYVQTMYSMTRSKASDVMIPLMVRNSADELTDITMDGLRYPDGSYKTPDVLDEASRPMVAEKLRGLKYRPRLLVKEFPTGRLTIGRLNAYLDTLARTENFKPDLLIIDYPALMSLNQKEYRLDLGKLIVDIRGVAVERNLAAVVVAQSSKVGFMSRVLSPSMIAEDFSQIGTADLILTYSQTAEEKERGYARILVISRNAPDGYIVVISQSYSVGQFCIDSVYHSEHVETLLDSITPQTATPGFPNPNDYKEG